MMVATALAGVYHAVSGQSALQGTAATALTGVHHAVSE